MAGRCSPRVIPGKVCHHRIPAPGLPRSICGSHDVVGGKEEQVNYDGATHRAVLQTAEVGYGVTDPHGRLRWVNRSLADLLGLPMEQAVGHSLPALLPGVPEGPADTPTVISCSGADQGQRWLEVRCSQISCEEASDHRELLYAAIDVTAWRERELEVAQQTYAMRRAQVLGKMGNWEWFLEDDRVIWSDALIDMLGHNGPGNMGFAEYATHVHPEDRPEMDRVIKRALRNGERYNYVHRVIQDGDETERVFECFGEVIRDEDGSPIRLLGTAHDITQVHHVHSELLRLSEEDPLTGLPNRRALTRALEQQLATGEDGALLLLDLDNFKDVNDLRGHAVGDRVMRTLASVLRERLDDTRTIGRLGGDEFAVVMPKATIEEADALGIELADAVSSLPVVAGGAAATKMTVSIGVAPFSSGSGWEAVLANADLALYASKNAGRNRVTVYDQTHYADTAKRVSVLDRLRNALDNGLLALHAMPMVDLLNGRTVGYELLLRLEDGIEPWLGPGEFLPAAERTDMILEIDRWVMNQAIQALHENVTPGLRFNVNVSGRTLDDTSFAPFVLDRLNAARVAPGRLGLEITETAAVTNLDAARSLAEQLRAAGCRITLDDFGAGFGSFVHLKHLPITGLKIDGEFVRNIDKGSRDAVLVTGIMEIARGLGLSAVAEWVERPAQVDALARLGVRVAQGFYVGKPRPLSTLLARPPRITASRLTVDSGA
ncbi:EAL domain-containing protein [Pseudonocardiaceae bacterium YIM PH 21723]|nr:EAL domain-containing protein [Pseudonocardiaceae bacterium YIM PH 21723]